jgi:tripartite-type tricarboxylate transporter receptor subunit TctC
VMLRKRMFCATLLAAAAFLVALAAAAVAQPYPTRPIKLLVSFPPGGASDVIARMIAQPLAGRLGEPVVVENRPGSNGNLAGELAAHATPDGTTLLLAPSSLLVINPHLYVKMPFDPLRELLPIASVASNALFLAANPSLQGVVDFASFIALAKRSNPPLFYASIGNGSEHHLAMEFLKQRAGIELIHVPYRGGGPAAIGVMAGDVAAMFGGGSVAPLVQAGKLRALAVSGLRRSPLLPEVPPIADFYPGFEVVNWQGLFAPVGTAASIIARLRSEVGPILLDSEFAEKLAAAGAGDPYVIAPEEFIARIRADYERYAKLIKATAVKVE